MWCRELYQYAHDRGWFMPGHGDLNACLELYSKCQDGRFRREDHTGYKMPVFCTPLEVAPPALPVGIPLSQSINLPVSNPSSSQSIHSSICNYCPGHYTGESTECSDIFPVYRIVASISAVKYAVNWSWVLTTLINQNAILGIWPHVTNFMLGSSAGLPLALYTRAYTHVTSGFRATCTIHWYGCRVV